jgi:hypothetical protein
MFRRAQRSHLRGVREDFLDKLSARQLAQLTEAWKAIGLADTPDTPYGT